MEQHWHRQWHQGRCCRVCCCNCVKVAEAVKDSCLEVILKRRKSKEQTKSTQKKRKGWAHVRRAQRSGHKTAILASFSSREKPFLFRKKVLMVGGSDLVSLSGPHSACKPCELPKKKQLHSRSPKVFPNYITVSRGCERVSERGKVGEGERRELRFSRRKLRHRLPTLGHR